MVVSPHLDDGALSVGQLLCGWSGIVVLTVHAGTPADDAQLTTFDQHCGFASAAEAVAARRLEDVEALRIVGAGQSLLKCIDGQYGEANPYLTTAIWQRLEELAPEVVMFPLGLAHPDHEAVAIAGRRILCEHPGAFEHAWLYEELPARVLWPEMVPPALDRWRAAGFDPVLDFAGTGPKERKRYAVRRYASQLWCLDMDDLFVGERLWRLW